MKPSVVKMMENLCQLLKAYPHFMAIFSENKEIYILYLS